MPNLDPNKVFENLKKRVEEGMRRQFPYEGRSRRLELVELRFEEKAGSFDDPHHTDNIDEQLRVRMNGGTWGVPVRARLRLVDKKTNDVIDQATVTLATLPKITRRYSYIIGGHERQHDSVFRSKPRPYHRITNGGDIEAQWSLARGRRFQLKYEPKKNSRILITIGTSNTPIYALLKLLGVSDAAIRRSLGDYVFEQNAKMSKGQKDIDKIFAALETDLRRAQILPQRTSIRIIAPEEKARMLQKYFTEETEVWPDAMKSAFGKEFSHVNGENLLLSAKKLVAIQKGRTKDDPPLEEQPDDRQSLSEKYLTTTEDFIVEALDKRTWELRKKVDDRIDREDYKIRDILSSKMYNGVIHGVFANSQRPDQANPLSIISGYMRTTIRGKDFGGVGSGRTNLDADKQINPTHLGFLDPIQSPESEDTGIALHLPLGISVARAKDRGGKSTTSSGQDLSTRVYDKQAQKLVLATPAQLERANVAYPDQVNWKNGKPVPVDSEVTCYDSERRTAKRPWSQVRYVLPSSKALLSFAANMVPFIQNNSGNRAMMAAKQQEQAVALSEREAPLVQVKTDSNATFEQVVGNLSCHRTPVSGKVVKIEPGGIFVKTDKKTERVPIYNHFPLNGGKTMIHATPTVKVGDVVKKGDLIADTNFTKGGALAMGANLRVAYIPWKGLNFEDGIVISESAAKRMSSEHMHVESITIWPGMLGGTSGDLRRWSGYALPERTTQDKMRKLDKQGVVKEGQTVEPGDILIAALGPVKHSKEDEILGRLRKSNIKTYKDRSVIWDHGYSGKVVRVTRSGGTNRETITVHVRTEEPIIVGDKMTGRHGNKGIVSRIVPDEKMPHDKDGKAVQVLLNPAGVVSRMNLGQALETAASKIAKKTGKPYVVENFVPGVDYTAKVRKELKRHGLSDTDELFDPDTGRSVGQVMTGDQYLFKLHHMVEKKMTARSFGGGYKSTGDAPSGAGIPGGGQKMDQLTMYAMLAHGSKHNLREAQTFKSDGDQEEIWDAVMLGRPLPPPQSNKGMKNFLGYLKAMGVNTEKRGSSYVLGPMTDAMTKKQSNGEIPFPDKLNYAKGAMTTEEAGGLFDPKITGGMKGQFWSHIKLQDRVPNPMFEHAIVSLMGIKEKEFEALVSGKKLVDGKSGFDVINKKLASINVEKELRKEKKRLAAAKGPELNRALKRVRYLQALQKLGLSPVEAYTHEMLPVLPPQLRRVSVGLDGTQVLDDRNGLYLAVGHANQMLKNKDPSTPPEKVHEMRAHLYDAIRALKISGLEQRTGSKKRHLTGLMEMMTGKVGGSGAPKFSYFQRGVLGRRQDLSGRSTIVPEPDLGLDEIGIPIPVALEMYRPFVVKELVRTGVPDYQAMKEIDKKTPRVMHALEQAVKGRPVLAKRDPALHKFSIMAFQPKLVEGKAVKIHPLVTGGFNADFDGDSMALYVPVGEDAVAEAHQMFPSKNIFSPTHYGVMPVPAHDSLLGIYQATKWGKQVELPEGTPRDRIVQMMKDGKLKPSDVVPLEGKLTTAGRVALAETLPPEMRNHEKLLFDKAFNLNKSGLKKMLSEVGRKHPQHFAKTVDAWKNYGNRLSFLNGSSFSLKDFHDGAQFRDEILAKYKKEELEIRRKYRSKKAREREIVALYKRARNELKERGTARYDMKGDNRIWEWAQSGARGGWNQFSQLVFGPMLVTDPKKKDVPVPITKSYGEGLSVSQYWASMHGARKGTLDRVQGTRDPGALTKDIINTAIGHQVTGEDCGTTAGELMNPQNADTLDRYLAKSVKLSDGTVFPAGELVTNQMATRLRNAKIERVEVRSPLFCRMPKGLCAKCYGLNENGKHHHVGTNIGVIAGNALGEPVTQLTMRTFHSGGVSDSGGVVDAFKRVQQLFMVPKTLPDSAELASVSGTVERSFKDAAGVYNVVIAGKTHKITSGRPLPKIRVGAQVKKGEQISTGPINPHHLLQHTGDMGQVRSYLASEIDRAYGGEAHKPGMVRKRNIDTVVRAMTNLTVVTSAPSESEFMRGMSVPLSEVMEYNRQAKATGRELVKHKPKLTAMTNVPIEGQEDWMARLNYQRLQSTLQEGAAQSWESDALAHPIPGLAHGATFGMLRRPRK